MTELERIIKLNKQLEFMSQDRDQIFRKCVENKMLAADASRLLVHVLDALPDDAKNDLCNNIQGLAKWIEVHKDTQFTQQLAGLLHANSKNDVNQIRKLVGV